MTLEKEYPPLREVSAIEFPYREEGEAQIGKSSKERNSEGPGAFTLSAVGKTLSAPEMSGTKALRRGTPVRVELGVAMTEMMMAPPRKKNTTPKRRERQEEGGEAF